MSFALLALLLLLIASVAFSRRRRAATRERRPDPGLRQRAKVIPFRKRTAEPSAARRPPKVSTAADEEAGRLGERHVEHILNRLGYATLTDIVLPIQHGVTQIDHLVAVGNAIVVVETKNWSGVVQGTVASPKWLLEKSDGTTATPRNPILQNVHHIKAVKALVPGAHVEGIIVFAGTAKFRPPRPHLVVNPSELGSRLRELAAQHPCVDGSPTAWFSLCNALKGLDQAELSRRHRATLGLTH